MRNPIVYRLAVTGLLVLAIIGGTDRMVVGGGPDVEQRIADFWRRIDAMQPGDYLSSADIGQWALNVIDRDATTRLTVADFRAATSGMQAAMDRAGRAPGGAATPTPVSRPVPTPLPAPLGLTRQTPAGPGVALAITVSSLFKNYDVTVSEQAVVRGAAANQMVKAANMFNSDPKPGMEYLLVSIRLTYVKGPSADTAYDASAYDFRIISSQGAEYDKPFCVAPSPKFGTTLYAGAASEGWACFTVNQTDPQPTMVFGRNYDGSGGRWWRVGW